MRRIVGVEHGRRNDARRGRRHEALGKSAGSLRCAQHPIGLLLDDGRTQIPHFAPRFGRILHPAALGEAAGQSFNERRKLLVVAPAPPFRFAAETRHPMRHVSLESHALLLAIIANVDAGLDLPLDHVAHRAVHLLAQNP